MSVYCVGYKLEGNLNLHNNPLEYDIDGHKVILKPIADEVNRATVLVVVEASSGVEAFRKGHDYADKLLDAISFSLSISLYIPGMSIVLKKQTGDTRREALTISYKPLNRSLWLNTTNNTNVEAVLSADNRLTLALRWLRIAYRARSSVEQFNNYWLALEAYTPSHQVERKCPHCNGDLASYETTDIPKIKEYLRHYNADLTAAQANQIVRLRHKLFHGGAGFSLASSNEAGKWRKIVKNTIEQLLKQDTGITPLDLNEPNTPDEKARIFSGVAFNTSTPTEDFAFDYPTEQHILAESQNTNTLDETGMEFLSTDDDFINTF